MVLMSEKKRGRFFGREVARGLGRFGSHTTPPGKITFSLSTYKKRSREVRKQKPLQNRFRVDTMEVSDF